MSKELLLIEQLKNNPEAKVEIALTDNGSPFSVEGFITQEMSFTGSNEFNAPAGSDAAEGLSNLANSASTAINIIGGKKIAQVNVKNAFQTLNMWTGSNKFAFSLNLIFVATKKSDDVREPIKKLFKAVFPDFNASGGLEFTMKAPLGYAIQQTGSLNTTMVEIGKWFSMPNLVIKDVGATFSKETHTNGTPLYSSAQISFESYRLLSITEVTNAFSI